MDRNQRIAKGIMDLTTKANAAQALYEFERSTLRFVMAHWGGD
jgi:hypothetical protein